VTPRLAIRDLTVDFDMGRDVVRALHGVDIDVMAGRTLGVVGESGCGKSVTFLAALRLLAASAKVRGSVRLDGVELLAQSPAQMDKIRGAKLAMIFQDPTSSLNPVHRIGTQLVEALRLHRGLAGEGARAEAVRLLDRVGITDARQRLGEYPHQLSGGMNQRVMIAMALAGNPGVLIADEPTTALDVTIQAQILVLLRQLRDETGMAIVLITHDLGVVAEMADDVAVMYCGRIIEHAPVARLFADPQHPYTSGLLRSLPRMPSSENDEGEGELVPIAGAVPEPRRLPPGCTFAPRCAHASAVCQTAPALTDRGGHFAACHRQVRLAA
jgi:peptide/nickel transport system ATP-binding protein